MRRRDVMALGAGGLLLGSRTARADAATWANIKETLFGARPLLDGSALIALEAPVRAHDAALVPVAIKALAPQAGEHAIKSIHLIIDENPAPLAGVFKLGPRSVDATISTRVRVNEYTMMHAVAETVDGKLWMVERFVKAAGGCSAPAQKDAELALARLGKMKLRELTPAVPGMPTTVELLISHPQYTGMQIDQLSRNWIPPDYIRTIKITQGGESVLEVESDISLAEDPALTFTLVAGSKREPLEVVVEDTEGRLFRQSWTLGSMS